MLKIKINKTAVERLEAPGKGYSLAWDADLHGFGVRTTASGVKSFVLQTRINGTEKRLTIGKYPGVSPEVARREAKRLLGSIAGGGDPIADRKREQLSAVSLEDAFERYLQVRELSDNTVKGMRVELENTFKVWKKKPLTKITRRMVETRYLERVKESKARANVAFRYLRAVFNFAASAYRDSDDNPIISANPVSVLSQSKLWRRVDRRKTVMKPADLATWVPAVKRLGEPPKRQEGTGRQYPKLRNGGVHGDVFLFCAMTGCRKSEALGLRKADVDLRRRMVTFRDTKNHANHELPLTDSLVEILKSRMEASPVEYVFASEHDSAVPSNFRTSYARINEQTGIVFTLHDLRRLAATSMERLGVPGYTIKAILNHKTGSQDVTGGYVQVDEDMMLQALKKLETFINNCGKTENNVVDIQSRRVV